MRVTECMYAWLSIHRFILIMVLVSILSIMTRCNISRYIYKYSIRWHLLALFLRTDWILKHVHTNIHDNNDNSIIIDMFCISIQLKTLHSDGLPRSRARTHCILQGFLRKYQKTLENSNNKKQQKIQKYLGKSKKNKI